MHYQQLTAYSFLLASLTAAAPTSTPGVSLVPRALDWTNQPETEPICTNVGPKSPDTAAYSNSDIETAIQAAVNAIINNAVLDGESKKTKYPHRNTPGSGPGATDSWADYNLDECAQSSSPGFLEFPILRDHTVYKGGKGGPDRVLFQFVTDGDTSKTYDAPGMKGLVGNFSKSSRAKSCHGIK